MPKFDKKYCDNISPERLTINSWMQNLCKITQEIAFPTISKKFPILHTEEVVPSVTSHAQPSDVIPIFAASSKISLDRPLKEINKTILTPAK